MGFIIVISLPVILLFLIVAIACYLYGRSHARKEATTQYYGPPTPPYGVQPHPQASPDKVYGRSHARKEATTQYYGPPTPPYGVQPHPQASPDKVYGRSHARKEATTQYYGPPTPPYGVQPHPQASPDKVDLFNKVPILQDIPIL